MEKLKLCLFKKKDTKRIAKSLGFDLKKTKCCICEKKIGERTIGHFVHYKHKKAVLCINPTCFITWSVEERPELYGLGKKQIKKQKEIKK